MRLWHAQCQGRLRKCFAENIGVEEYWASIDLFWVRTHNGDVDDETFYEKKMFTWGDTEYFDSEIRDYQDYCYSSLCFMRKILLDFVVFTEAGEMRTAEAFAAKVASDLPNPKRTSPNIGFINDSSIKSLCQQHMASAVASRDAGAYLPALYQTGAALEGILYGVACQQRELVKLAKAAQRKVADKSGEKTVVDPVEKWSLDMLLAVACELGWINKEGGKKLGEIVRDYRNYIHPARFIESGIKPNEGIAGASWNGLETIVSELDEWIRNTKVENEY